MTKHIITIILICALIALCMFLPFLPGRYDMLAITLSFMAQLFSLVGLLLVPLGLFWLWFEMIKRKTTPSYHNKTKHFAIATVLMLGFITLVLSLVPLTDYNISFGIFFLSFCFYVLSKTYLKIKRESTSYHVRFNPTPIYLIIIPIVMAIVRLTCIDAAVQFSRTYAIKKSAPLITAIEAYYARHREYPISLQALHTDILPGIIGIRQYHYERNGTAYNVYFKQFSDELDVEEIVMYNKLDEHAFAAHVLDILEYSGSELSLMRGDRHRYKLSIPHWLYIKFE